MIHLTKVKTGYMVVTLADNGKVLTTSEILKSKRSAWINIEAQLSQYSAGTDEEPMLAKVKVQDDTKDYPEVWEYEGFIRMRFPQNPKPKYIPGKNPKRITPKKSK